MISIVVPTYNRLRYLRRLIASVINQTYTDWELIVVDDSDIDDVQSYCESLENERIRYIRNKVRRGVSCARNLGIAHSRGEYILSLDDDTYLNDTFLEEILKTSSLYIDEKIGAICGRLILVKPHELGREEVLSRFGTRVNPCISPLNGDVISSFTNNPGKTIKVPIFHAFSAFPKKAIQEVGCYSQGYSLSGFREETDLCLKLENKGYKFVFNPKMIVYHADHYKESGSGVRATSLIRYEKNRLRDHPVFLRKFFGARVVYMYPFFVMMSPIRMFFDYCVPRETKDKLKKLGL